MNLIDGHVTKVLSEPILQTYEKEDKKLIYWWEVEVEYWDDGGTDIKKLSFSTEEKAREVKEGYVFQH